MPPRSVVSSGADSAMASADGIVASEKMEAFIRTVWEQGRLHSRELPWRFIDDPYAVLVSEVMLQQTQVVRVLGYWERFLDRFPTVDALAAASTAAVLESWQGLGYNRRALMLKSCAEECAERYAGQLPATYDELIALPGIGPATAAGVRAFAFNQPGVYLETNVRSVFLHHWFADAIGKVADRQIVPLVEASCPSDCPREWYYDLLDYGAFLKREQPNPSRKSAHHTPQSTFEGSRRQKRAELVRIVLENPGIAEDDLRRELDAVEAAAGRFEVEVDAFDSIIADLVAEGFFSAEHGCYRA